MIIKLPFAGPVSAFLCASALVLTLLSLCAGSPKGFMEDFAIVTLNTSCIGGNLIHKLSDEDVFRGEGPVPWTAGKITKAPVALGATEAARLTHAVTTALPDVTTAVASKVNGIGDSIKTGLEHAGGDFAKALGLLDFYSAHLLGFCEGFYVPGPVSNASVSQSIISKNVTACSEMTITHVFDPQSILQQQLSHTSLSITDLQWPDQITTGMAALQAAQHAMMVLYCVAVSFMFFALVSSMANLLCCTCGLGSFVISVQKWVAACSLGLGATMVTVVAVKSANLLNTYGIDIGISATIGYNFLALIWIACLAIFAAAFI